MTKFIYCLYDVVAAKYLPVFESGNDLEAIRLVLNGFKENLHELSDYKLICLAKMTYFYEEGFTDVAVGVVPTEQREIPLAAAIKKKKEEIANG